MSNVIDVAAGEHATFATIRTDTPTQYSVPLDDYKALGEVLADSMERVGTLEAELAEATALIAALGRTVTETNISAAASRQALRAVQDQLKDARDENVSLHAELAKTRQIWTGE